MDGLDVDDEIHQLTHLEVHISCIIVSLIGNNRLVNAVESDNISNKILKESLEICQPIWKQRLLD